MEIYYNKLIRDNIPEIIRANGQIPVVRTLDDDEYLEALTCKLQEEVAEYLNDNSIDELCDILEVVYAIAKAKGYPDSEISACRNSKNAKNGAFEKKLFLESVTSEDI